MLQACVFVTRKVGLAMPLLSQGGILARESNWSQDWCNGRNGYADECPTLTGARCASVHGFSLHANVHVQAHRRDQLERLIRSMARGALALERLQEDASGDLVYTFTKPWSDGTDQTLACGTARKAGSVGAAATGPPGPAWWVSGTPQYAAQCHHPHVAPTRSGGA